MADDVNDLGGGEHITRDRKCTLSSLRLLLLLSIYNHYYVPVCVSASHLPSCDGENASYYRRDPLSLTHLPFVVVVVIVKHTC
jgi:hypothetical protein